MPQGEFSRIGPARIEDLKQPVYKTFLSTETRQQCEVNILGQAGLTPTLHRDSSDEAEWPSLLSAESLNFASRSEHALEVDHGRGRLWKMACCSTKPDQSGRSRQPPGAAND